MIRKKKKDFKVDLIITADWHLFEKERNPPCRLDSIWDAQWDKVKQIIAIQEEYECPIVVAGDVFNHWKTSPHLLNKCIKTLPFGAIHSIIGNHDMPQHNLKFMQKSGLDVLFHTETIQKIQLQGDWGFNNKDVIPQAIGRTKTGTKFAIVHMMTWKGKRPWSGCTDPEANEVFDMFPDADLIITGHNHKTFTARKGKRVLINPGSLTRHKADQVNHKPCVFLWNAETNTYKIHYLKIKKNVISRDHIEIKKNKDKRINAFIEKLKDGWDLSLSFEDNLERAFKENDTPNKIKELILKWMED